MYQRFISIIYQAVFVKEMGVKYKLFNHYHLFTAFGIVKGGVRTREKGGVVVFSKLQIRKEDKGNIVFCLITPWRHRGLGDKAPHILGSRKWSIILQTF
jgi:hypothetical protein